MYPVGQDVARPSGGGIDGPQHTQEGPHAPAHPLTTCGSESPPADSNGSPESLLSQQVLKTSLPLPTSPLPTPPDLVGVGEALSEGKLGSLRGQDCAIPAGCWLP